MVSEIEPFVHVLFQTSRTGSRGVEAPPPEWHGTTIMGFCPSCKRTHPCQTLRKPQARSDPMTRCTVLTILREKRIVRGGLC